MSVTPNVMHARISDEVVPNVDLEQYRNNVLPLSVGARLGITADNVDNWLRTQPWSGPEFGLHEDLSITYRN